MALNDKRRLAALSAAELRAFLDRSDLTNADAARILAVSKETMQVWLKRGVTGAPARLIAYLIEVRIPLHAIAQQLGLTYSTHDRSQYAGLRTTERSDGGQRATET